MTYTKGCDTIYRVLEDVKETLSKTRRWAARQSAEKLTGAQGCNVERELVKIDGRNRSNVQRDAETLAAVDDANVECGTAMDMAYHNHPSRRPHVVGAETSGTGSVGLKGETYPQPGVGQNSRSGTGQEIVPNWGQTPWSRSCPETNRWSAYSGSE